jgi:uncharacterized protein YycO
VTVERVPAGQDASNPQPGDFILVHRKGLAAAIIRFGEGGPYSHAAYVETPDTLIESLTRGTVRTPLSVYRDMEYAIVRTHLSAEDEAQATAFVVSCVGQVYGWPEIAGLALRYLTPGQGLWFGMDGTEICSGLVAQGQVRGWANFPTNAATVSPEGLRRYYA